MREERKGELSPVGFWSLIFPKSVAVGDSNEFRDDYIIKLIRKIIESHQ